MRPHTYTIPYEEWITDVSGKARSLGGDNNGLIYRYGGNDYQIMAFRYNGTDPLILREVVL